MVRNEDYWDQKNDGRKGCEEDECRGWMEEAIGREEGQFGGCGYCFGLKSGSKWKLKEQR